MKNSLRTGLVLLGLLSIGDIADLALTDGSHPPYAIAAIDAVLGIASLYFLARAWKGSTSALPPLLVLRVISALSAAPALFVHNVPAAATASAVAIIALTALGVILVGRSPARDLVTR